MPRVRETSSEEFRLFQLPPEIRLRIWRYVVVKDGDVVLQANLRNTLLRPIALGMRLQQGNDEERLRTRLAVIFTCRQFYLEVAPIYYGENTFLWSDTSCLCHHAIEAFAGAVGRDNATTITAISLYDNWYPGDKYLSMLPGLKRLYIRRSGWLGAPERMANGRRSSFGLADKVPTAVSARSRAE
ncbi:hypothetical protein BDR22DRAFT_818172 [Usnea florida]